MRKLTLVAAAGLAVLALAAPANSSQSAGLLTIKALNIYNMPIGNSPHSMAFGPFWHFADGPRPGQGKAMVIGGHDVTPVPGYGLHGPFYDLATLKPGYLIKIRWQDKLYIYRVVATPRWHPENDYYVVDQIDGQESLWIYSCWPRYTHNGREWLEAILVNHPK